MRLLADNIHIMNPDVAASLERMDPEPIRELALRIKVSGADAIDINPGPLRKDCQRKMELMINAVQESVDMQLCLDTPNPDAIEAGLAACARTPIINGFSLEPHKLERILPLAVEAKAETVGFLLREDGSVPATLDERLSLAAALLNAATEAGLDPENLVIDPVLVPIAWGDGSSHARDVLSCIRYLPELLGFSVKTVAGLSNLTSGSSAESASHLLEEAYIAMLAEAGLDMALMNVFRKRSVTKARICDAIKHSRVWSWGEFEV